MRSIRLFFGMDCTPKQREIIDLVLKFRFINRIQIQTLLHHKDARRINAWLKDLVEKQYLGRIYSRKLLENTKPAIYFLSYAGINYLKEQNHLSINEVKKLYEDKHASQTFITHCVTLVDYGIQFQALNTAEWVYTVSTKTELWNHECFGLLRPDLYIEKRKQYKTKRPNAKVVRFFIDLFDPHVPRYALRYRMKQYIEFNDSYEWKEFALRAKFPYILLVLPNEQKLRHLRKYIQEQLNESYDIETMRFMLTTYREVIATGVHSAIWETVKKE
ncbi:MAG: replication-relaxation family protein [Candidatus Gottesmanbacteria bacterium]|nr:replication-relaxation family protein [Candidatus Gottesmanbacteria bacterium]